MHFRIFLFILLSFCAALPVRAFETPSTSESQIEALRTTGQAFLPIALDFGCTDFTWAAFSDPQFRIAQLEYVPKGHDVRNWTRLQTTTVYALTGRADVDTEIMNGLSRMLRHNYRQTAEVIDLRHFESGIGEPAFYIEYKIGEGDAREHNAGVFMRTSDRAAAFMQIQARGGELDRKDTAILLGYLGIEGRPARTGVPGKPSPVQARPRRKPDLQ